MVTDLQFHFSVHLLCEESAQAHKFSRSKQFKCMQAATIPLISHKRPLDELPGCFDTAQFKMHEANGFRVVDVGQPGFHIRFAHLPETKSFGTASFQRGNG